MIGAMRPLVIGLRSVLLGLDAGWCSDGVEVLRFGGAGLIGGGLLPGVRGRAVIDESLRSTFSTRLSTAQRANAAVCTLELASGM